MALYDRDFNKAMRELLFPKQEFDVQTAGVDYDVIMNEWSWNHWHTRDTSHIQQRNGGNK